MKVREARFAAALRATKDVMARGIITKPKFAAEYLAERFGLKKGETKRLVEAMVRFAEAP